MQRVRAWRQRIRDRPLYNRIYRVVVGLVGGAITIGGLLAIPLPGPGWLVVFLGLAILATEFVWAAKLNDFAREQVTGWTRWLGRQPTWIRGLVSLAICAFVAGVLWVVFALTGVPGWVPDSWVDWIPGLEP